MDPSPTATPRDATAPDLSVIVLNWNAREDLRRCLASVEAHPPAHDVRIVVADNDSHDGSAEMVAAEFPQHVLVRHPRNAGFGAGNNRALPLATGRYVMFLNPDTVVWERAFDALIDYGDAHPDVGILGAKLLNPDGSLQYSCRRFPNLGTGFYRNTPLGRMLPGNRWTSDYLMRDFDHASPLDVDWVSGAALVIRREALQELKGFDEDFYMYCEDVDLCMRAHRAGWRVVYIPDAVITHVIGRSSDLVPARMTYEFHRSMYTFYRKHYAASTPLFVRPLILPGIVARAVGQIARYRWRRWKKLWSARRAK